MYDSSMDKREIQLAIAERMLDGHEEPLRELYPAIADEMGVDWESVQSAYRSMRGLGLLYSSGNARKGWKVRATPDLKGWFEDAVRKIDEPHEGIVARAVISSEEHKLPKDVWKVMMGEFKAGRFKMAFIPADAPIVAYKDATTGKTIKVETWTQ